jgi:hypothetical protein
MATLPTRIPTTSTGILDLFFNKTTKDIGTGARDVTELQPPQTQGLNALALAEYIIDEKGVDHPCYTNAIFFKEQWKSGDCYICGFKINETGHTMELEHVLPIAEALALTGIIQDPKKTFTKPNNLEEISDTPYAKNFLLEYARSHRCCNQIKSATSFLSFNLNASDDMQKYTPNLVGINKVLNEIYYQGTGQAKLDHAKFQEEKACANLSFRESLQNTGKKTFIENRRNFIIDHYITPIIIEINALIRETTFNFAQLVFLANQAMSIDQRIWKTLEGQQMNEVKVDSILLELFTNSISLNYKNTRKPIADNLVKFLDKFPRTLYKKAQDYVFQNLVKAGSIKTIPPRKIDLKTLLGFLNVDYDFYKKIYFENISKRLDKYDKLTPDNEGLYGFQYMYYLLENQDPSIKFTTDQYSNFNNMMNNVNDFMILYIYIYIIFYNPFIKFKKEQKDLSDKSLPIDYEQITTFKSGIRELETFNLQLKIDRGMGQIHENFCNNKFSNLNYVIEKLNYTDIRELENYGIYVTQSTDEFVVANYMIQLGEFIERSNKDNSEKYKENIKEETAPPNEAMSQILDTASEEVSDIPIPPTKVPITPAEEVPITPAVGGIKIYKKIRKNNSTKRKRKSKTRKNNYRNQKPRKTRKNNKSKTKRKLRYTKKY